ncbi:hypothetical protein [Propionivibrio sp.]|uniref:hypothetical protein n=1 Tax=Propionivibrio sp. TaxID=2212460 RepID=UPI003BF38102
MNPQEIMAQFAGIQAGGAAMLGGSLGGSLGDAQELQKALTANMTGATDVAGLTGGAALGVQSLDTAMKTVVQEEEHFVLFKKLQQSNATNVVDEYTRQNSIGGVLGGSTNGQMGTVRSAQGEYSREIGLVKFLMTLRQVGYVLNIGKNLAEPMAVEERNGALQLLTDAEYLLFNGNAAASPTQYDGIFTQIDAAIAAGKCGSDHVIDMAGTALTTVEPFTKLQAAIQDYGNWGRITETFMPTTVQTDLNMGLDPAFRWSAQPNSPMTIGGHVEGIRLTEGVLKTNVDTFLHHGEFPMSKPIEVTWPATATANAALKPASVTIVASADDTASMFTAARAGNYYYAVAGIGGNGEGLSAVVLSSQTAVAAGKKAVLTITQSSGTLETGYAIYRSRQDGTNAVTDFRLVKVIARTSGATTTFTDINRDVPGTVSVPCLNMNPASDAIGWRQFQPMTKIPLPFGIGGVPVNSWFQFLFGYLRVTKPKHHGYIKNILPVNSVWRPHSTV